MKAYKSHPSPKRRCKKAARIGGFVALPLLWLALPLSAMAAPAGQACTAIKSPPARLACYDQALGRSIESP